MNKAPEWIPLMDYAMKNGVSLSTLRRQIKSNKIPFKVEQGRYLLQAEPSASNPSGASSASGAHALDPDDLRTELQRAREEIAELKMLVAIYEEQHLSLNG